MKKQIVKGNKIKKVICVIISIVGVIIIISGISQYRKINIPSTYIEEPSRYVGGDAYNYIIEGGIKGGQISGALVSKKLSYTNILLGIIILSIGLITLFNDKEIYEIEDNNT
jgi:hypothetical protein